MIRFGQFISGFVAISVLAAVGCGGGGTRFSLLQQPVDVKASDRSINYRGSTTKFVFVADQFAGGVVVVDQRREEIVDLDAHPDFDETILPVGGETTSLAVDDSGSLPRVFVADAFARKIFAFQIESPAATGQSFLVHTPVDLGTTVEGRASRSLFRDRGRASSPTFGQLVLDPNLAQNENWEVEYIKDDVGYRVTGSVSGEQVNRAVEGTEYVSDTGAVRFLIQSGGERTTKNDRFLFGTTVATPWTLTGKPEDLHISGTQLFVVTSDPPQVVTYDLSTLTETASINLTAGSMPGRAYLASEGTLYVSNRASADVFAVDTTALTQRSISAPSVNRAVGLDAGQQFLYVISASEKEVHVLDATTDALITTIRLSHFGSRFASLELDGLGLALVSTVSGGIDVVDVASQSRLDTVNRGGDTESEAFATEFFDALPLSQPELIAVNTADGVTRTERWQVVYEGIIPGAHRLAATVSGTQVTAATASFVSNLVAVGDTVILNPTSEGEEIVVTGVTSETELELSSAPTLQGAVTLEVRATQSYVVIGSESGAQAGRVVEGTSFLSDDGGMALTVRPSRDYPTTRGDYFTFLTDEGIDPIQSFSKRLGQGIAVFTRPDRTVPTAYVAQQGTGQVSALNLSTFRERRTIQ